MTEKTYRIKPLEWERYGHIARTECRIGDKFFMFSVADYGVGAWFWRVNGQATRCMSREDGKKEAEAWWREQLAKVLEEVEWLMIYV